MGGVVNVITHRIETDLPAEPVRGALEVRGGSAAREFARGGVIDVAATPKAGSALVLHVDAFRRSADNLKIPGFAESAAVREAEIGHAAEHGEPAPAFAHGRLPNSALETRSGAVGLSFVTAKFHFGASYSGFDSDYGVPGHAHAAEEDAEPAADATIFEGTRIDLRQRRTDLQGEWHGDSGWLRGARVKFGHAHYRHTELEPDGAVGTVFTNRGYDARFEVLHGDAKPRTGALGAQLTRSDFGAVGSESFLPPSRSSSAAVFAFEEIVRGPLTWQLGARYEQTTIATSDGEREDGELSGSAGLVWRLSDEFALAASLAQTGRAPNAQELFANGPHAGTQSFEIGDANLSAERSLGAELSLRRRTGLVTGAVTLFAHRFRNFIFEQPTGFIAIEHDGEWEFEPADDPSRSGEHDEGLPVYQTMQSDARFWGAEMETIWHLHDEHDWQLDLRLAADLTRAQRSGVNLPRIPAPRITGGVSWANADWSAGAECQVVFDQRQVAPEETTTGRYTMVSAHVTHVIELGHVHAELFLRGTNLTNAEARLHTSLVKAVAPLAGRGVMAGIRVAF